jgi:hypothetical protein
MAAGASARRYRFGTILPDEGWEYFPATFLYASRNGIPALTSLYASSVA